MEYKEPRMPPPHALFDNLIDRFKLRNDAALCRLLGVPPTTISKVRHRPESLSDNLRVIILRKVDMTIQQLDKLAPPARKD